MNSTSFVDEFLPLSSDVSMDLSARAPSRELYCAVGITLRITIAPLPHNNRTVPEREGIRGDVSSIRALQEHSLPA